MISPKGVGASIRRYLEETSSEQFREDLLSYYPQLFTPEATDEVPQENEAVGQASPLKAYFASALTSLTDVQRTEVFALADVVVSVCSEMGIKVYEPRKNTDPRIHPDVSDERVFRLDRHRIAEADLLIFLGDHPSFGGGLELDFAYNDLLPVLLIAHNSTRLSRMVTGIPVMKSVVTYNNLTDLQQSVRVALVEIKATLQERRTKLPVSAETSIGENIRYYRKKLGLSREAFAAKSKLINVDLLSQIEEYADHISNPSIIQLKHIADVLQMSIEMLIGERVPS